MPQLEHAMFAPSSAARIVKCPGSVKMVAQFPEDGEAIDAKEGTASHWAGSEMLLGRDVALGQCAPNGVVLSDEMIDCAEMYANYIDVRDGPLKRAFSIVEKRLEPSPRLHPENWGTPDHRLPDIYLDNKVLYIDDYKYGHKYVEIFGNWQLLNYAILMLNELGIDGHEEQFVTIEMTIHQPRNYHRDGPHRVWRCMASDLRPYANILRSAFEEAMKPDARLTASDECYYCPARHACPAAAAAGYRSIDIAYESNPLVMTPHAMGTELKRIREALIMLKARESGLSAQVLSMITRGKDVPYFGVQHGKGRTVFASDKQDEVINIASALGVDISKKGIKTPLQALKAGLDEKIVKFYSQTPTGAAELVEVDTSNIAKVFSK